MDQITDRGILLMVLISDVLIIASVALVLAIARSLSSRQPDMSERIIRSAYVISVAVTVVFGVLAETIIVLMILWTVDLI